MTKLLCIHFILKLLAQTNIYNNSHQFFPLKDFVAENLFFVLPLYFEDENGQKKFGFDHGRG